MLPVVYRHIRSQTRYIDPDELRAEVQRCIDNGRVVSNALGLAFCKIVDHMLTSRQFSNYSQEWKEDMRQLAIEKLMRSMQSVDLGKCKNIVNYYSRIVYLAFITQIVTNKKRAAHEVLMYHFN